MDERINKIHELLDSIKNDISENDDKTFVQNFNALELPSIISTVIRFLQPMLKPYEAAIYWYMLEKSVLSTGKQYCKVSTRGLMNGVVLSSSGQSESLSIAATRGALQGLESKGAILTVGEPDRSGTPYKVLLPEEIPACQKSIKKSVAQPVTESINEEKDLDFYNVPENRLRVFERDEFHCHYCNKQLTRFTATLDHIQPVSKGGDNSYDNLVTACLHCNSRRGNRPVMDIIASNKSEDENA